MRALLRSGARVGDDIWVSGQLGDAALGLAFRRDEIELPAADAEQVVARLERPTPRVRLGARLVGVASSAIDISDGLAGDLRHVLRASGVGAVIDWSVCRARRCCSGNRCTCSNASRLSVATITSSCSPRHPSRREEVIAAAETTPITRIGTVTATADLAVLDERGAPVDTGKGAYDHFGR